MTALSVLTIPPPRDGPTLVLDVWCRCRWAHPLREPAAASPPGCSRSRCPAHSGDRQRNKSAWGNSFATYTSAIHFVYFAGREAKWCLSF